MISLEELKETARLKGLSLGNTEKDYLISLMLFIISKKTKSELVFKGGTCLSKFYGLDRFSEDIDFTAVKTLDVEKLSEIIAADMKHFGIDCSLNKKKEPYNSVLLTFRCEGPLYKGLPMTFSSVRMDINFKSTVDIEPLNKYYSPQYQEIPRFSVLVMDEKEILAEKIRAIFSRTKARDVYDMWFLLKKGVKADKEIIMKKLEYYNDSWNMEEFQKRIEASMPIWENELARLLLKIPSFDEVKTLIMSEVKKWKL